MTAPIQAIGLSKRYGKKDVVQSISFDCQPGTITGFLGPNGAGKSTTMRMLVGLTKPSSGTSKIFGVPYAKLDSPGTKIGVSLDSTSLHPGRTGLETLRLTTQSLGLSSTRAQTVLEKVGLADAARKRVGKYSLGMRQRLALGVALVGGPDVLILDEPYNGLDPDGVRWVRELLRDFAASGGTVLLSSHLLAEVAGTVDSIVVIADGAVRSIESTLGTSKPTKQRILTSHPLELSQALKDEGIEVQDDGTHLVASCEGQVVGRVAALNRYEIWELTGVANPTLEHRYMELVGPSAGGTN